MNIAIIAKSVKIDGVKVPSVTSIDMPGFEFETIDVNGTGIMGTLNIPIMGQLASMETTLHTQGRGAENAILRVPGKRRIEILTAEQTYAPGKDDKAVPGKIFMDARLKGSEGGSIEHATAVEGGATYEVTRLQEFAEGKEIFLADKETNQFVVNGIDYMKPIRAAIQ